MDKDRRKIGIGIVGYSIGRAHARGWLDVDRVFHPSKALPELVAIAGRTRERVKVEASRFGFSRWYTDWKKLVYDDEVEIVDNCTPPYMHHDICIAAAEAGKNVICEKPMARNAREAKKMLEAVEKARVANMVGYNYRFIPSVILAKQIIDEGRLGKLYYYKGSYLNAAAGYYKPEAPFDWHHSSLQAGYGALGDLGTHAIDMARFLVGEIASVQAVSKNFVPLRPVEKGSKKKEDVDVDDVTVAAMTFSNGTIGMLETSWMTPGRTDYLGFEVYGSKGSIRFNIERINELELYLEDGDERLNGPRNVLVLQRDHPFMKNYWVNQANGFSWENTFTNELSHYLERLVEGKSVAPEGATFLDGYKNCMVMDAIIKSSESGKRVEVV